MGSILANILCGNGSDELLGLLASAYLSAGDEGIFTEHGFLVYKIQIMAQGATPVVVKETNETASVDAILAAVTPQTKIVFLANPNNPTGTYVPMDEVKRLQAGLRPEILLVIDAGTPNMCGAMTMRRGRTRVLVTECCHDTYLFQDLRPCCRADRLDVCAIACHRCTGAHPRAIQPQLRCDRFRCRRHGVTGLMWPPQSISTSAGCHG